MTRRQLERKVDLYKVVEKLWGIKDIAATRLIADGQLTIDGHAVRAEWAKNHWTVCQLRGRYLACPQRGQHRLFGSGAVASA